MTDATVSADGAGSTDAEAAAAAAAAEATQPDGLNGEGTETPKGPTFSENDYRAGLPAEISGHPALKELDSIEKLASEHVNAQKLIGAKGIIPPDENATDEDRAKFYEALGRPATIEDYDLSGIEVPEGVEINEELQGVILSALHSKGATQEMVDEVFGTYWKAHAAAVEAGDALTAETWKQTQSTLRTELGNDEFAEAEVLANRVVSKLFAEGTEDVLNARLPDGSKLKANLGFMRGMIALAKQGGEGALLGDKDSAIGSSPDAAKAELAKFEADNRDALLDRSHKDHKTAVERRRQLTALAHPEDGLTVQALG